MLKEAIDKGISVDDLLTTTNINKIRDKLTNYVTPIVNEPEPDIVIEEPEPEQEQEPEPEPVVSVKIDKKTEKAKLTKAYYSMGGKQTIGRKSYDEIKRYHDEQSIIFNKQNKKKSGKK